MLRSRKQPRYRVVLEHSLGMLALEECRMQARLSSRVLVAKVVV